MDKISKILCRWRRVALLAGVFLFATAAVIFAQNLSRGKIFEIKKFRPVRLGDDQVVYEIDGKDIEKGLELSFRIKPSGDFSGIYYKVTLYDSRKQPIRNGIRNVLYDRDARQTTSIGSKEYAGIHYRKLDNFKGKRTYTFTYIPARTSPGRVRRSGSPGSHPSYWRPGSASRPGRTPPGSAGRWRREKEVDRRR